jgi:hypothetical protein
VERRVFSELRIFKKSSTSKTLLFSVVAIPERLALPVMTTTQRSSGEVLLSVRDLS